MAAQQAQRDWRVPASVSIAQWELESGWGEHMPPGSNNPFGIKARAGEPCVIAVTTEHINGRDVQVHAAFRRFDSLAEAFDRHAELLASAPVYASAMALLPDEDGFVAAMAHHYATDPQYAAKLLAIIASGGLRRFDALPTPADIGPGALMAAISHPQETPT